MEAKHTSPQLDSIDTPRLYKIPNKRNGKKIPINNSAR
jgi:hypothetical protein